MESVEPAIVASLLVKKFGLPGSQTFKANRAERKLVRRFKGKSDSASKIFYLKLRLDILQNCVNGTVQTKMFQTLSYDDFQNEGTEVCGCDLDDDDICDVHMEPVETPNELSPVKSDFSAPEKDAADRVDFSFKEMSEIFR